MYTFLKQNLQNSLGTFSELYLATLKKLFRGNVWLVKQIIYSALFSSNTAVLSARWQPWICIAVGGVLLHNVAAHNVNVTGRVCYLT